MRASLLAVVLAAGAAGAVVPDLSAPGGGPIRVDTAAGRQVAVTTDHWRLEFDLEHGGVLERIAFPHGSGRNLLVEPLRTYVDRWSDKAARQVSYRPSRDGDVVVLRFQGVLSGEDGSQGPVGFDTIWTISPFVVRAEHRLQFREDVAASRVGVGSTAVRGDLNEYGFRSGATAPGDTRVMHPARFGKAGRAGESFLSEGVEPLHLILFHRALEGFDFTLAAQEPGWEKGLYEARLRADGSAIEVLREPLHTGGGTALIRKGDYAFRYYLGLPRIVERSNRKWRHLSFGNHPWPSDAEIARWAENGVNVVRMHNDYSADGNFWHDGAWPPYDETGMAEARRVIAACHRHGIAVVPYFSIQEFHPEAPGYAEHERAWRRTAGSSGQTMHNRVGKGEYGAQMCPMSNWLDRRKADIEKAYRELGFDGIYYDWVMSLPCNNREHAASAHVGTDGVMDLLAWTRRLVAPKGVLVLHLYGATGSIAMENFADLVVSMEEVSDAERWMKISEVPLMTRLAESIPHSPCPSYRVDHMLERNQNNISQLVVLGMFPAWRATGPSVAGSGGPGYELTLKLFRDFLPYRLENYRFQDAFSGAVRTTHEEVYGAAYGWSDPALVVISNTSAEERRAVGWRVDPEKLGMGHPDRVSVQDMASKQSLTAPAGALEDGSLQVDLRGYEYRLFEIRAAR